MKKELQFLCPLCGSNCYGTSDVGTALLGLSEGAEGHCHGYRRNGNPCTFTWKRKADYANFVLVCIPENRDEYNLLKAECSD